MASSSTTALTSASLQDENQLLQQELNKVEDLLSTARAERDEIIIRYNALNDRVSSFFLFLDLINFFSLKTTREKFQKLN